MQLDKSSDGEYKDVQRNVKDEDLTARSPEETGKSLNEKDNSLENDDGSSKDDYSCKGPVYDNNVNKEGHLFRDATKPDFVPRVKRFCEKYESHKVCFLDLKILTYNLI